MYIHTYLATYRPTSSKVVVNPEYLTRETCTTPGSTSLITQQFNIAMDRPSLRKRKAPLNHLQRRVRARKTEPEPEPEEVFSEEETSNDGSRSEDDSEENSGEDDVDEVYTK